MFFHQLASLIWILALCLCFTACGADSSPQTPPAEANTPADGSSPTQPTDPSGEQEQEQEQQASPESRQAFTPTSFDAPCDVRPALTTADLNLENEAHFEIATFEEEQGLAGAVISRTFRQFNEDNTVKWRRIEQFDADGCLGIASTAEWIGANQSVSDVKVLNEELAFDLSPYMPISTYRSEMQFNSDGNLTLQTVDAGSDGELDHRLTNTYDDQGRLILSVGEILTELDDSQPSWSLDYSIFSATESYTFDSAGNLVRKEWIQNHGPDSETHTVYVMTYDSNNNRLTQTTTRNSQIIFIETNTWDGNNQLTQETVRQYGSHHFKQWSYRANGTLSELDHYEDFQGDQTWDRNNRYQYDEAGNQTQFKQDQPYDGTFNWQEDATYNENNAILTRIAINLNTQVENANYQWQYDDNGNEILYIDHLDNEERKSTYNENNLLIQQDWLHPDGSLRSRSFYAYTPSGKPLEYSTDHDGDGIVEITNTWIYDAGENLCHHETHNGQHQTLYLY